MQTFIQWWNKNGCTSATSEEWFKLVKQAWNRSAENMEERFKSTNSKSMPCPHLNFDMYEDVTVFVCKDCGKEWH